MKTVRAAKGGDTDMVVVATVIVVALSAIIFVSLDVYSYYQSLRLPVLTLLNAAGLAENYPNQIFNATPVSFELQVLKPQSDKTYGVFVYISNGSGYTAEAKGPTGIRLFALVFPRGEGNFTIKINFTLIFMVSGGVPQTKAVILNNYTGSPSLKLPYGVVGLFFELYEGGAGSQTPIPYAWTSLWLSVKAE